MKVRTNMTGNGLIFRKQLFYIFTLIVIFIASFFETKGQVAVLAGGDYCTIRHKIDLQNVDPVIAYHAGMSVQYYPFKTNERFSLVNELLFRQKGYQQKLDKIYKSRFNYIALPILASYQLEKTVSLKLGIELDQMVSTNVKRGLETFNQFDVGLVLGLNFFDWNGLSCNTRVTYGLLPMLDYYEMDEFGNLGSKIHDFRTVSVSLGIKYSFIHEKIQLFQ